jgi:transcriptional regulator with GAF, ATPase, and Fis domain
VNVRLIAATNRDLEKMIAAREFRSDLYYRLNVFPIRIPPLRERKEDIPLLVSYFVEKFAKQMQKKIDSIPAAVMKALKTWEWPGNIRRVLEQEAWNLGRARIGGHISLHSHDHPVHAGWLGTFGGRISRDGRERGLSDERRGSARRVVLPA